MKRDDLIERLRTGFDARDWAEVAKSRKSLHVRIHGLRAEGWQIDVIRVHRSQPKETYSVYVLRGTLTPKAKARAKRDAAIIEALRKGKRRAEVAREFGLTASRVCQLAKLHGLPALRGRAPLPLNDDDLAFYRKLRRHYGPEQARAMMGLAA